MRYSSTLFSTSALEGVRGQRHAPASPYPRERPGTHCTGGWVGLRAGLEWCGKSRPTGIRSQDRSARRQSLYRLHYPAHGKHTCTYIYTYIPTETYMCVCVCVYIYIHTGCHRRNGPNFGRVFLMLNYTDITQNTYVQS